VTLFTELKDHVRQVRFRHMCEQVGGRFTSRRIHAHVERFVAAKAEAASVSLQLHRRHAQISEHACHLADTTGVEHGSQMSIVGVH
jgi:hypothetical protein